MLASFAIMSWEGNVTYDGGGGDPMFDGMGDMIGDVTITEMPSAGFSFNSMTSFKSPLSFTPLQWASLGLQAFSGVSSLKATAIQTAANVLSTESTAWNRNRAKKLQEIKEMENFLNQENYGMSTAAATRSSWRMRNNSSGIKADQLILGMLGYVDISLQSIVTSPEVTYDLYDAMFE